MKETKQPDVTMFLASSAHDMKNSLSMLSGLVERFLGDFSPDNFPGYGDLSSMLYEVKRINQGLVQLLALYKIGEHLYPFDPQPILLSDFVEDLVAHHAPLLTARRIELESDCPDGLVGHFDEDLVEGVIGHALNNATNYTKSRIRLAVIEETDHIEIRVEDDGPGFPPSMLCDSETPPGINFMSGSTGLGLYFARTVASIHKNRGKSGALRLENGGKWGGGCFVLELP
jgi:signal transduction histidine kinase